MHYDLVVMGSGPSGQKAAIAAAKLNKRVAIVERRSPSMEGVCLHTGTIPSKTIREAILHLSSYDQRDVYGEISGKKRQITMQDIRREVAQVTRHEFEVVQDQLDRNRIDVFSGAAQFVGPHDIEVAQPEGTVVLSADNVLIAVGTKPARPARIPFDGRQIIDSDELLDMEQIPRSMIVVGGGVIGIEYAIMLAILGVQVTVVDGRQRLLEFCDHEIADSLLYQARSQGVVFRLGEDVIGIDRLQDGLAAVQLESGQRLVAESVLWTTGRVGDTGSLNLKAAGLETDERGRLWCNENHQTWVPHIYGVGDVVGFPILASVSMEQGRRAVCHAFGQPFDGCRHMPYGLFTIPEISMVGKSEEQLSSSQVVDTSVSPSEANILATSHTQEAALVNAVGD
jgi:NAD(P) transhydrogenase